MSPHPVPETAAAASPADGRRGGSAGRLYFLDALRGVAAVYVVCYHMLLIPEPHLVAPRWAERVVMVGGTGVTLFFIVSAFSLCYTMPLRLREPRPLFSFYAHRFFRIAPLFYFLIAATLVRDVWMFAATHPFSEIALSATFLFNLVPLRQDGFVWASWTVGVEVVFYAMFPLIYARVRSLSDAASLVFICLLSWLASQLLLDYLVMPEAWKVSIRQFGIFRHLPIFAVGVLVYHVFVRYPASAAASGELRGVGNVFVWGGVFAFSAWVQGWLPPIFGDSYYWQGVAFGMLFLGLSLSPWRAVVNGATRHLGRISYSIYLNHPTVVLLLTPVYHALYRHVPSLTVAFLCSFAVTMAVLLPLSSLTYRWIEEPGVALGKRVIANVARRRRARAQAVAGHSGASDV